MTPLQLDLTIIKRGCIEEMGMGEIAMSPQNSEKDDDFTLEMRNSVYVIGFATLILCLASSFGISGEKNYYLSISSLLLLGFYFAIGYQLRKKPSLILIIIFPILVAIESIWVLYFSRKGGIEAWDIFVLSWIIFLAVAPAYKAYKSIKNKLS